MNTAGDIKSKYQYRAESEKCNKQWSDGGDGIYLLSEIIIFELFLNKSF